MRTLPIVDCEIIASIAAEKHVSGRFDLMLSHHPEEDRPMTELEESAGWWHTALQSGVSISPVDEFSNALALWQRHWGDWRPPSGVRASESRLIQERWEALLSDTVPLAAAYIFLPTTPTGPELRSARRVASTAVRDEVVRRAIADPRAEGRLVWTSPFFLSGEYRTVFERVCGLSGSTKDRLGIDDNHPGFLLRYAAANDEPLESLMTPRQFEYFTADVLRDDGWDCKVTRYSKDGGIDVEATRVRDGIPSLLLVQAKRKRGTGARHRSRPVTLGDVKTHAATVRGEGADRGLIVTSSTISGPARDWAATKGMNVAEVAFLEGSELEARLLDLGRRFGAGDVASYFVDLRLGPPKSP